MKTFFKKDNNKITILDAHLCKCTCLSKIMCVSNHESMSWW